MALYVARSEGDSVNIDTLHEELWQEKAACRGPDRRVFFPPSWPERRDDRDRRETRAKAICTQCSVRGECLDYALRIREQHGIWGGLTELERRNLLMADQS